MFKVDKKDTRNTPRSRSGAFIVNFEHISHLALINNRTTRTGCEICFKLKIKTPEWCHWHEGWTYEDEHISHLVLFGVRTRFSKKNFQDFSLNFLSNQMIFSWPIFDAVDAGKRFYKPTVLLLRNLWGWSKTNFRLFYFKKL